MLFTAFIESAFGIWATTLEFEASLVSESEIVDSVLVTVDADSKGRVESVK